MVPGEPDRNLVVLNNPMHRSGLAVAGAEWTLEARAKGKVPPSDNDGIVTAEEEGGLKPKAPGWSCFRLRHRHWRSEGGRRGVGTAAWVYSEAARSTSR